MIFAKNIITTILLFFALIHITNAEDKDSLLIRQLKRKADSLNAEFAKQTFDKKYYSLKQGRANYFRLKGSKVADVEKDIANGISFEDLVKKYDYATILEDLIVVLRYEFNRRTNDTTYKIEIPFDYGEIRAESFPVTENIVKDNLNNNKWLTKKYYSKYEDKETIYAMQFTTDIISKELPSRYVNYINYYNYFIKDENEHFPKDIGKTNIAESFIDKLDNLISEADGPHRTRIDFLDSAIKNNLEIAKDFDNTIEEAIINKVSDEAFEELVEKLKSKEKALKLKKSRRVWSFCGNDDRPWLHRKEIARLAYEAADIEEFLKSNFDVNNFSQLENVLEDKLINITLGNPLYFNNLPYSNQTTSFHISKKYYHSKYKELFEQKLTNNILDTELDDYNRIEYYKLLLAFYNPSNSNSLNEIFKVKLDKLKTQLPKYYNLNNVETYYLKYIFGYNGDD